MSALTVRNIKKKLGVGVSSYVAEIKSTGTFTCNGTSAVTVADAAYSVGDNVSITLKTVGGTVGALPALKTVTEATGFTVAGTASDTSVYQYTIWK